MFEVKIKDKYRKGIKVGLMPFGFIIPENWEGFPLRKDYVDEVNMIIK